MPSLKAMIFMNEAKLNYHRAATVPLIALLIASAAGVALVGVRVAWTGRWNYLVLVWNLFLAWLPLLFALGVCRRQQRRRPRGLAVLFAVRAVAAVFSKRALHLHGFDPPQHAVSRALLGGPDAHPAGGLHRDF